MWADRGVDAVADSERIDQLDLLELTHGVVVSAVVIRAKPHDPIGVTDWAEIEQALPVNQEVINDAF